MDNPTVPQHSDPPLQASSATRIEDSSAKVLGKESTTGKTRRIQDEGILLPLALFLATCVSTFWAAGADWRPYAHLENLDRAFWALWQNAPQGAFTAAVRESLAILDLNWRQGLIYMAAIMAILLTHEMGHFLMAWRYGIPASLPFFIPIPILPFGTMGAVISMEGSQANRRQMFDLGTAGPLTGLFVAIPITLIGIWQLPADPTPGSGFCFHNPLIFQLLIAHLRPEYPTPTYLYLNQFNPYLMAGWVGMFVTGLNMLPVSQLDGGHVAYALLDRGSNTLARGVLVAAMIFVLLTEQYGWVVMLVIVIIMGIDHPPTANDRVALNPLRRAVGWLCLLVPILCLSPIGISYTTH